MVDRFDLVEGDMLALPRNDDIRSLFCLQVRL